MVVVPVILTPRDNHREEVDRLLRAFKDSLASNPPDGMEALVVLRTQSGELIVEGHWRDAAAHRAYRSTPRGGDLFTKLAGCCETAPVTFYGTEDPSLSFHRHRDTLRS